MYIYINVCIIYRHRLVLLYDQLALKGSFVKRGGFQPQPLENRESPSWSLHIAKQTDVCYIHVLYATSLVVAAEHTGKLYTCSNAHPYLSPAPLCSQSTLRGAQATDSTSQQLSQAEQSKKQLSCSAGAATLRHHINTP